MVGVRTLIGTDHLDLIRLIYLQRKGADFVAMPSSKSDKARAPGESFAVILDDLFGPRAGNEPFDQNLRSGVVLVAGGNCEDETRTSDIARLGDLDRADEAEQLLDRRWCE